MLAQLSALVTVAAIGTLVSRKETTRKFYRDAYEAFRRFLDDAGLDPAIDGWERLPPNVLAAFYRWGLDHRRGGLNERTAASYAYADECALTSTLDRGAAALLTFTREVAAGTSRSPRPRRLPAPQS